MRAWVCEGMVREARAYNESWILIWIGEDVDCEGITPYTVNDYYILLLFFYSSSTYKLTCSIASMITYQGSSYVSIPSWSMSMNYPITYHHGGMQHIEKHTLSLIIFLLSWWYLSMQPVNLLIHYNDTHDDAHSYSYNPIQPYIY